MTKISRPAIVALLLFGLAGCGESSKKAETPSAETSAGEKQDSASARHFEVAAFADVSAYRAGGSYRVAVVIDIDPDWHIYGNPLGPGIGQPTIISAKLPPGFSPAIARYASAEKQTQDFGDAGGTWVWEHSGKVVHFLSGTIPPDTLPGDYPLEVQVSALVCQLGSCLPGSAVVPLELTVSESENGGQEVHEELFRDFDEAAVPIEER